MPITSNKSEIEEFLWSVVSLQQKWLYSVNPGVLPWKLRSRHSVVKEYMVNINDKFKRRQKIFFLNILKEGQHD